MATYLPKSPHAIRVAKMAQKDVLKDHSKTTSCCLICKEFSKYRETCPKCNRQMINFGNAVKNPKKGSATQWKAFLKAYAWFIYHRSDKIYPCKAYQDLEQHKAGIRDKVQRWRYRGSVNAVHKQQREILEKWVLDFDKFLDKNYRGKK